MNTQYLTYREYTEDYGGTLPETSFKLSEFRARKRIDYLTASRVKAMAEVPEEVKLCMLSLINLDGQYGLDAQIAAASSTGDVASFNTDGYSESYITAGNTAQTAAELEKQANREIMRLLDGVNDDNGTPMLYRGLDR